MIRDLNHINKKYWKNVPTGETTSSDILPANELFKKIPIRARVLDIGCGDGKLSELLSEKGYSVSAIDINKNVIANCQRMKTKVDYSLQDITNRTTFNEHFFDLVCLRFTLANIHRREWPLLRKEIDRIVSPRGLLWLAEPLISKDYKDRYKLAEKLLKLKHTIFVFKESELASKITNVDQLKTAIKKDEILRISMHYTKKEIIDLFPNFKIVQSKTIKIISPSGFTINTFIGLLKKLK